MSTQAEPAVEEEVIQEEDNSDLRSVIERTFDALEAGDEQETELAGEQEAAAEVAEEAPPVVEADAEPGAEPTSQETQEVADEVNQEIKEAGYPDHWDPQFRDDFDKMDPWAQKFLLDRHKAMESDYTRKTQEHSEFLRSYQPVDEMMRAFAPAMQQQGISQAELIRRWAAAESALNANPAHAIKQLMTHYGVNQDALYDQLGYDTGTQDPQVQALQQQVANLTTSITAGQRNASRAQIDQFAAETTEAGTPAHPYFDDVVNDMVMLAGVAKSQGKAVDLGGLYDQACWMNTSVRQKMVEASQSANSEANQKAAEAAAKKATDEARQKAEKAKRAAKSVTGDPGAVTHGKSTHKSLRAAISDAYDNAS